MKIRNLIVLRVSINVMDNLSWLRANNLAVLPLSAASPAPVSQPKIGDSLCMMAVASFNAWAGRRSFGEVGYRANHLIAASRVGSIRHSTDFLLVGIKRVAVLSIHLIMPKAHLIRYGWPVAMDAWASDYLSAPSVIRRSMPLNALIVHEAKAMRGMLPTTSFNRTKFHSFLIPLGSTNIVVSKACYKAIGNSWAVPIVRWIGERIAAQIDLTAAGGGGIMACSAPVGGGAPPTGA